MIEPEMAFCGAFRRHGCSGRYDKVHHKLCDGNAPEEMEFFNKFVDKGLLDRLQNIVSSDFERITYTEAVEMLRKIR